ncbi:MAG TPA: ParB/RepB/Spo0J family partition protein [Vicinamibacteria bacterium]
MSSPRRLGLPETHRLRHDLHYVDQLGRPGGAPIGQVIPIEDIEPNPRQPRQTMGDLSELVASIREKGVLEPILVRPHGSRFQIIAGERRYRAACEVGLAEVPCIVRDASDAEVMEIALVENLQRKDLSPFEEADGLRTLAEAYGYTHEKMAEKLGKSRSSITETLSLTAMPEAVREVCRLADIRSKSLLLQVVRQSDPQKMMTMLERLQRDGGTREDARRIAKEAKPRAAKGRPRHYIFRYQPREKSFTLSLQFKKSHADRDEIIHTLQAILAELTR